MFRNKAITDRLKNFSELNVDFVTREERVFTFGRHHVMPTLYWPTAKDVRFS